MVEDQGQCNALIEHLLDNLIHLLPNMYPHASTSNTAVSLYYCLCFKLWLCLCVDWLNELNQNLGKLFVIAISFLFCLYV